MICSFTEKPVVFHAPEGFSLPDMKLILSNYGSELAGNGFVTKPYEARVYLYE